MAKHRGSKRARRGQAAAEVPAAVEPKRAPAAKSAPAPKTAPPAPSFWFDFEIPWAKLAAARTVLFALLAVDAFLAIRHAPRYGAGGFGVGHFAFLDDLGPGRAGYEIGQLVATYLFAFAALGVATRFVIPAATALYAWLYFGSQLDSYQHHYLVAILLAIACFVPWHAPPAARPATPVRTWAVRLLLVQLAIVYLWAAIGKLAPAWLDGSTLAGQLGGAPRWLVDHTIGMRAAAIAVIGLELVLAATIWWRRAWPIAAPLGIALHVGIQLGGFEIGLFSYLMLGLYLLVLPDRALVWAASLIDRADDDPSPLDRLARRKLAWVIAVAAGIAIALLVRLESALPTAIALSILPIALIVRAYRRGAVPAPAIGKAHLAALALWFFADRGAAVAPDYYKYWAGSQRRLGNLEAAEHAYRRLVAIDPEREMAHYHLGRILLRDRAEEGLAHLREAQRLAPQSARAWVEEARWLAANGRLDEARMKAQVAVTTEPGSSEARALFDALVSGTPNPFAPAATETSPDDFDH